MIRFIWESLFQMQTENNTTTEWIKVCQSMRMVSLRDSMNWFLLAIMASLSTSAGVSGASGGGTRLATHALLHCFPCQQQPGGINLKPIQDFHPNTSASLAVGRAARVTLEGRGADRLGRGVTAGGALLSCLGCLGWLGSSSSSSSLMSS